MAALIGATRVFVLLQSLAYLGSVSANGPVASSAMATESGAESREGLASQGGSFVSANSDARRRLMPTSMDALSKLSGPSLVSSIGVTSRLNTHSRYASWETNLPASADLRPYLVAAKDQAGCSCSWAFAASAALEGAYNRLYQRRSSQPLTTAHRPPVAFSEQELLDCGASSWGSVAAGGWPRQAFEWGASSPQGLATTDAYGAYKSGITLQADTCKSWVPGTVTVARYEHTPAYNEELLRAVVSQQPVVAFMTLTDTFKNWRTWDIFTDAEGECEQQSALNHVVAIVGYGTEQGSPYWIVRNSLGSSWGAHGHARVLRQAGRGICGITATPGLYPIIARIPGSQCWNPNPCGLGRCHPGSGTSYTCSDCPSNYTVAASPDGSQACALADVCSRAAVNPCGAGTCVSAPAGAYHCICFLGYRPGVNADGTPTCSAPAQGETAIPPVTYTTKPGDSCSLVAAAFGLTVERLTAESSNQLLQSSCLSLPPHVTLSVANPDRQSCQVLYPVQAGDSCWSIEQQFGLVQGSLNTTLNPGLECGTPTMDSWPATWFQAGQQVCVKLGQPDVSKACSEMHTVSAEEAASKSCTVLYANRTIDIFTFFEINRGINCAKLYPGQEVCVDHMSDELQQTCLFTYNWKAGDTCASVAKQFCCVNNWQTCTVLVSVSTCSGSGPPPKGFCLASCKGCKGTQVVGCTRRLVALPYEDWYPSFRDYPCQLPRTTQSGVLLATTDQAGGAYIE